MSVDANALERETLERKDREELSKIVGALGGKATSRTRKADLIDQILELTGVTERAGAAASEGAGQGSAAEVSEAEPEASGSRSSESDPASRQSESKPAARSSHSARKAAVETDGSAPSARSRDAESDDSGASTNEGNGDARTRSSAEAGESPGTASDQGKQDQGKQDQAKQDQAKGEPDDGGSDDGEGGKRRRRRGRNRDGGAQPEEYTGEPIPVAGILDLRDDGYGFLRVDGLLPSKNDCYVSVKQVRQFGLRKGDKIAGGFRPAFRNEKNPAMLRIDAVNDVELAPETERPAFEDFRVGFATEPLPVTPEDEETNLTARIVDLLAPFGKGSRVLVLAPPRSGATSLLQTIARSIELNEPDAALVVALIDERPEEISEMQGVVSAGQVFGSAFDAPPEDHVALTELALARARRLAEAGDDVVVVLDGLTRLARADHAGSNGSGRMLGGLDVASIQTAKRAFGAGRDLVDAGSITVIATAAVDAGSPADDAVVDALRPAATTQIRLDADAAARRAFPAVRVPDSGSRREEQLIGVEGAEAREALRRMLAELPGNTSHDQAVQLDHLLERLRDTASNEDLLQAVAKERNR